MSNDEECRAIMALPVVSFSSSGPAVGNRDRLGRSAGWADKFTDAPPISADVFIQKVLSESGSAEQEEIERLKAESARKKISLTRDLENIRFQVKTMQSALNGDSSRLEKLRLQKDLNRTIKALKQGEQSLFMDSMCLDVELEKAIQAFIAETQLVADVQCLFSVVLECK